MEGLDATLTSVEASLAALELALAPVLPTLPALCAAQDALGSARLHGCLASATAVLLAAHLRLSGVDTGAHAIAQDFAALQRLGARVKQVAAAAAAEREAAAAAAAAAAGAGAGAAGAAAAAREGDETEEEEEEEHQQQQQAAAAGGGGRGAAAGGVGQPRSLPSTALNVPASKRVLAAAIGKGGAR